jgi:hypothetical protein
MTWTELQKRCAGNDVTVELVRDAVAMLRLTGDALQTYNAWRMRIAPSVARVERVAQVAVLNDIRKRLRGHDECRPARRWIESRDVVVTGPTNADGIPVQCSDPICREWHTEIKKVRQAP